MKKILPPLILSLLTLFNAPDTPAQDENDKAVVIKIHTFYDPNKPEMDTTKILVDLMRKNPDIRLEQWGGIRLPNGSGKASLMMSIAGKTAPDIGQSWFHIIRNEIKNGFLYPLNEWIGYDKNGNGQIDDNEAIWPGWKKIKPLWRQVATVDGKVYGIPTTTTAIQGIIFRVDLVEAAGLDPNKPPRNWDEFIYWCQKLTDPNKNIPGAMIQSGQRGVGLPSSGWQWLPWIQTQGGHPIIQLRTSPKTGKTYTFSSDATDYMTPDGENLENVKPEWRANFASEAGIKAAKLIYKLRWMKWLVDPKTGEPVNLTKDDIANGYVMVKERKLEFKPGDIITGCSRGERGSLRGEQKMELFSRGEVAMVFNSVDDMAKVGEVAQIDPSLLSWFPYPAGPGEKGQRVVQIQNHFIIMYEGVGDRPKEARDDIWKVVELIGDSRTRDNAITQLVLMGYSRFVNPDELKRLGFEEYIRDIPQNIRNNFSDIESGRIKSFTEPWSGFWFSMDIALTRECLGIIIGANGEDFDYRTALTNLQTKANSGVMFETPKEVIQSALPYARMVFGLIITFLAIMVIMIIRARLKKNKASSKSVYSGLLAWSLVLPALLIIGTWRYYPLVRGMVMAFQDYKITGDTSEFVGLKNFIILFMDMSFWRSLLRTGYFVFLNMLLAFTMPIILAILLTEVPRFKIFFRTLFFLPQMTSGLVIALLWKLMYNPTPQGFFNQIIDYINFIPFVNISHQTWLDDPKLAMICCVLPTVWASMGMASLIYLAALHSIPQDLYEAAEVDGAGIFSKIRNITLPTILPLIIINFVGAFIGTFQNMGSIFLLTFGGPGEATTVVGLKIWMEAYNNLRFSMATSMAWVLGSLLIGFTYIQIQFLNKVEYRKAIEN